MTIKELRDSLLKLPPECDNWPVTILVHSFKVDISPAFIVPPHSSSEIMLESHHSDDKP